MRLQTKTSPLAAALGLLASLSVAGLSRAASAQVATNERSEVETVAGEVVAIPCPQDYTVICFLGTECPLAKLYAPRLVKLEQKFASQGFQFLAINSNQQDSKTEWLAYLDRNKIQFPAVKDREQALADRYSIQRTPEVVVVDGQGQVFYRGRIDDQYLPGVTRSKPQRNDLQIALSQIAAGQPVSVAETEPEGCLLSRVKKTVENPTVTYAQHVAPIFQKHCVECHQAGDIGPFVMDDYDEIVGWGDMIIETIDNGRMPPWHADPNHGSFTNERRLTANEKDLVRRWVDEGYPIGDESKIVSAAPRATGWQLPRQPDVVLPMRSVPFTVPADGSVEYQYFVVDPGFKEDKWVSAAEVIPGNRSVVHHSIVFVRPPDGVTPEGIGWLSAFVPGQRPPIYDPTIARKIPAGSKLVFQQHYTTNGTENDDLTKIGIVFANPDEVRREMMTLIAINQEFEIPPGESAVKVPARLNWLPKDGRLHSVSPHMHFRGKAFSTIASVKSEAEDSTLLRVNQYDFNWQHIYEFSKPIDLNEIETIDVEMVFDNSDENLFNPNPNEFVMWGDQTWEEMAVAFFSVSRPIKAASIAPIKAGSKKIPPQQQDVDYSDDVCAKAKAFAGGYFATNDANGDGVIQRSEMPIVGRGLFGRIDKNDDGQVAFDEVENQARLRYHRKELRTKKKITQSKR
jgi:mono/diheme cytochrome c family protein